MLWMKWAHTRVVVSVRPSIRILLLRKYEWISTTFGVGGLQQKLKRELLN